MQGSNHDSRLDMLALARMLEAAGWDVIASLEGGELAARLEHPPSWGVWILSIDRSGRVRFRAVRETRVADGRLLWRGQRQFRLLKEAQEVLTLACELARVEELPELLGELAGVALADSRAMEGEVTLWDGLSGEAETASGP